MFQRLLRQTRGFGRLAIAGVAVFAVLLAASVPKAAWAHEGRAEEAISEATEHFGPTWTPYDGPAGEVHDLVAALPDAAGLPHAVATLGQRARVAVSHALRAPFSVSLASRAPPARR